ncbi:MAG: hypothetical protein WCU88_00930 [Elusimicrobiota bacterium]|jgi:hypothetical protein
MAEPSRIGKFLEQTQVLRIPKHSLSTFGATSIEYHLVSPVDDMPDRTRLREGCVVSEKPKILTPQSLRERFEGFGEDSREFEQWLGREYRELLRALEYRFKNLDLRTSVIHQDPRDTVRRIQEDADARESRRTALILCPDAAWSLALMKFTLDEAARSFPGNVHDLERRGFFESGGPSARARKNEIERLFEQASTDPSARDILRKKLQDCGLFSEYEDRFLNLFNT